MNNRFVSMPTGSSIQHSRFNRSFSHKGTMSSGVCVPLLCDEVLPGDIHKVDLSSVTRMLSPAVPVMDNAFIDFYFFFVPNRLTTRDSKDWQRIHGENFDGYWANNQEYTLYNTNNAISMYEYYSQNPDIISPATYLRIPYNGQPLNYMNDEYINLMPFIGYVKIWNEFFRDQNTQAPIDIDNYLNTYQYLKEDGLLKSNKYHDYFTSCLPAPQKGDSVLLPLGDLAPLTTSYETYEPNSLKPGIEVGSRLGTSLADAGVIAFDSLQGTNGDNTDAKLGAVGSATGAVTTNNHLQFTNVYADLANATAATINNLRTAFAIQRLLEKDSRYGTRYREMLQAHYNTTLPDYTAQVPQYLGGKHIPLNMDTVAQTSQTTEDSYLGQLGAYSNTSSSDFIFEKAFNEFGYLYCIATIRTEQSYSQGLPRMFSRNRRYDFYYPVFAHLGEQPVYKKELYVNGNYNESNKVFGYQEAWAEYRYLPNAVSGYLVPNADALLDTWTYTNHFNQPPVLNSSFMVQSPDYIAKTLVDPGTDYQFLFDVYFKIDSSRPMPLYSVPGLIDHF